MTYNPSLGGHAPGLLRDEFIHALDEFRAADDEAAQDAADRLDKICGTLWNCSDILPGRAVSEVDDLIEDPGQPRRDWRTTYAGAARQLREFLKNI